ncbi:hypothetical protein GIB67_016319 [Kingdonia uniflora]|uniref:Protein DETOXIFICATION n=1 Tax=Kingdonia uniflora TaxID=39325 RepID=A0A7J7M9E3_9MAGN|nr:hypothetical protein GIB67_016319 [Kingdonia uniflora]
MISKTPLLENAKKRKEWWRKVLDLEEAKAQIFFSVSYYSITSVSYYSITMISVMFAGHLGQLELSGATLGNSWVTVTGIALMTGISGALETLCGQGYGVKLYKMLGIYLQSSIITTFSLSILLSILWFNAEPILVWLHQEPEVAKMAALYVKYLIPGLFAYGFLQSILRFLQTQTVIMPLVLCSAIPFVIHIGIAYVFVHHSGLGFKGAPLSASLSLWISLLMLVLYVKYSEKFKYTWEGLSMESFHYVIPNLKLAIPFAVMVCLEYWAFGILVLVAGLMSNSENSTSLFSMCLNTEAVTYMITYGFSAAVRYISHEFQTNWKREMGNGDKAKNAVAVTLKLSVLALTMIISLLFGHNIWASFFSDSSEIINDFASMTPLLALAILFDSAQGVLSGFDFKGVARGCGWQHLAAWTNLTAYYVIGMPIGVFLAFKIQLYSKGLWIGLVCGLFCQTCFVLLLTLCTKWTKMELSVKDDEKLVLV